MWSVSWVAKAWRRPMLLFFLGSSLEDYTVWWCEKARGIKLLALLLETWYWFKLQRSGLGPYANEKQMPSWLRKLLKNGAKRTRSTRIAPDGTLYEHESVENETPGIVPVLARLCEQDKSVGRAFLCNPNVYHVSKMSMEGGFCGYRNIQMLISYIRECHCPGHEHFSGPLPTILQLQDMIERAWDLGFNSVGRLETGGIRGTRKFIGTLEVRLAYQRRKL